MSQAADLAAKGEGSEKEMLSGESLVNGVGCIVLQTKDSYGAAEITGEVEDLGGYTSRHLAQNADPKDMTEGEYSRYRKNNIAFFLFGAIDIFGCVLMMAAAGSIVGGSLPIATVIIAEVLPSLVFKLVAPWCIHHVPYWVRLALTIGFSTAAFYAAAFLSPISPWLGLIGPICVSIGGGMGETTFLTMTSYYHKNVVSAWSAGSGLGCLLGSGLYFLVHSLAGLDPKWTLVIFSIAPISLLPIYLFVLQKPEIVIDCKDIGKDVDRVGFSRQLDDAEAQTKDPSFVSPMFTLSARERISVILPLLQYIIPLAMVYFIEYGISSGVYPVMTFSTSESATLIDEANQYVLFQFLSGLGAFIARCSVQFIHTRRVWIFVVAEAAFFFLLFTGVRFGYLPGLWFASIVAVIEGLTGGAVYVNCFYAVARKALPEHKELSMGLVSISDTLGILTGAICGIFIQHYLCGYNDGPNCV
eukprot:Nk52_evm29s255 gene=Nk52_evmTU29s255